MPMTEYMQAVVMTAIGGPEVLELQSVPRPQIAHPEDLLVRVIAAGVNPADIRLRKRMPPVTAWDVPPEGIILGLEGSGVVEAVGSSVTRFKEGDEVYYFDGGFPGVPGNYAQFKVVNQNYVAAKPRRLSFAEAAVLPVVTITTWEALQGHANLAIGESLLVQGGAGGLGHMGIQLGKLLGARVATTVSDQAKADLVRRLGADCVIRYRDEDVASSIQAWTDQSGVDVVYDTVGDAVFSQSVDLLAAHGRLVSAAYPTAWPNCDIFGAALKNIRLAFEAMGHALGSHDLREKQTEILEMAAAHVDAGDLQVVLDRTFPLKNAGEAQSAMERGEIVGRLALEIGE
jgi:NADPH:quinone reductase